MYNTHTCAHVPKYMHTIITNTIAHVITKPRVLIHRCNYMYNVDSTQPKRGTIHANMNCYILYPIVQRNHWFANLDVPFQSVKNDLLHGQFAMQTYAYIRYMLHLNFYTRGGLHMRRVITKQLMYGSEGLVFYFYQLDQKLVRTNPMLHAEPYINYYF